MTKTQIAFRPKKANGCPAQMYQPESVKLYVKPVCGWCRQAEHWLTSQGIEFETVDVIENPKAFEEMERISGQTLAPVIAVDDQVLADFGARELVVFWEGLGKAK
jgi:glutaredoxin 3